MPATKGRRPSRRSRPCDTECAACHLADDIHKGRLGTACDACRTVDTWADADIDHDLSAAPRGTTRRRALPVLPRRPAVDGDRPDLPQLPRGGRPARRAVPRRLHPPRGHRLGRRHLDHAAGPTGFALEGGARSPPVPPAIRTGDTSGHRRPASDVTPAMTATREPSARTAPPATRSPRGTGWTFDHARSWCPLTGAHRRVSCQGCHAGGTFKGTPSACAACRARPASHGSVLSGGCASCHTTRAWRPASFNGPHPFPMSHGGAGGSCATCHPSSLTSYSCTAMPLEGDDGRASQGGLGVLDGHLRDVPSERRG